MRESVEIIDKFPFKKLLFLALATALAIFAMGIIIPIIPFYLKSLGGEAQHAPYIYSIFSLAALLSSPLWGSLSDKYGRKQIMLIALFGTALSYGWLSVANDIWHVYGARAMAGLTAGWMATSQAYIADVTDKKHRAKGMGLMGAAFGVGFTLGPALGAFLFSDLDLNDITRDDFILPSLIALGLSFAAMLLVWVKVKEPEKHASNALKQHDVQQFGILARWFSPAALQSKKIFYLILLYFAVFLVFTAVEGVFAIWAAAKMGFGPKQVGYLLAYGGLITIFIQGGLIAKLAKTIGEAKTVILALINLAIALALFGISDHLWEILLAMSFLALAMGLHNPSMQSLISQNAPEAHRGRIMGTAQSAMSFARILGPAWGAQAFGLIDISAAFWIGLVFIALILPIASLKILK